MVRLAYSLCALLVFHVLTTTAAAQSVLYIQNPTVFYQSAPVLQSATVPVGSTLQSASTGVAYPMNRKAQRRAARQGAQVWVMSPQYQSVNTQATNRTSAPTGSFGSAGDVNSDGLAGGFDADDGANVTAAEDAGLTSRDDFHSTLDETKGIVNALAQDYEVEVKSASVDTSKNVAKVKKDIKNLNSTTIDEIRKTIRSALDDTLADRKMTRAQRRKMFRARLKKGFQKVIDSSDGDASIVTNLINGILKILDGGISSADVISLARELGSVIEQAALVPELQTAPVAANAEEAPAPAPQAEESPEIGRAHV